MTTVRPVSNSIRDIDNRIKELNRAIRTQKRQLSPQEFNKMNKKQAELNTERFWANYFDISTQRVSDHFTQVDALSEINKEAKYLLLRAVNSDYKAIYGKELTDTADNLLNKVYNILTEKTDNASYYKFTGSNINHIDKYKLLNCANFDDQFNINSDYCTKESQFNKTQGTFQNRSKQNIPYGIPINSKAIQNLIAGIHMIKHYCESSNDQENNNESIEPLLNDNVMARTLNDAEQMFNVIKDSTAKAINELSEEKEQSKIKLNNLGKEIKSLGFLSSNEIDAMQQELHEIMQHKVALYKNTEQQKRIEHQIINSIFS